MFQRPKLNEVIGFIDKENKIIFTSEDRIDSIKMMNPDNHFDFVLTKENLVAKLPAKFSFVRLEDDLTPIENGVLILDEDDIDIIIPGDSAIRNE